MDQKKETKMQATLTSAHHDFERGLNAYAFSKVHSHSMSDDLVQDTFIKTWRFLIRKGKIHVMKAFLYHVLNGLVIDEYRKHRAVSLDALIEEGFEPGVDDSEKHLDIIEGKAAITLIENLPEKYRGVIRMRYIKMLSLKEMSLITGETRNSIAVQIHRGIKKLKSLYNKNIT